jgi:hypothetical protein
MEVAREAKIPKRFSSMIAWFPFPINGKVFPSVTIPRSRQLIPIGLDELPRRSGGEKSIQF